MKVFVSYSSHDDVAVRSLTADLQRARQQVWLDQDLGGGEAWWAEILEQIRSCTVFVFALSNNSLYSTPCRAELDYATALGLPILPVQIGVVSSFRTDPIFSMQFVDYRDATKNSVIDLVSALHERATRRLELPDPLPEPPPIPYEYLQRLGATIHGSSPLSPEAQAAMVLELRAALHDEQDNNVGDDIRELLRALRARRDVTYAIVREIDSILDKEAADHGETAAGLDESTLGSTSDTHHGAAPRAATARTTPARPAAEHRPEAATEPSAPDNPPHHGHTDEEPPTAAALKNAPSTAGTVCAPPATPSETLATPSVADGVATGAILPPIADAQRRPLLRRLSRRNRIALLASAVLVVAAVVAAVAVPAIGHHTARTGRTPQPSQTRQVLLPFTGLHTPYAIAVDLAGNVYVTDHNVGAGTSQVLKLAAGSTTQSVLWDADHHDLVGVAVDSASDMYLADISPNQVIKLTAGSSTATVLPFSGLKGPGNVAVDGAGDVYLADHFQDYQSNTETARVLKLAAGSTTQSALPFSGLVDARGLAVDSAGDVFVSDFKSKQVLKLAAGSSTPTRLPFTGLNGPGPVAVNADGDVYIADFDAATKTNRLLKLAAGSTTQSVLPLIDPPSFPDSPHSATSGNITVASLAVDSPGDIYVLECDFYNGWVLKLPAS
jgi:hypothetical protein